MRWGVNLNVSRALVVDGQPASIVFEADGQIFSGVLTEVNPEDWEMMMPLIGNNFGSDGASGSPIFVVEGFNRGVSYCILLFYKVLKGNFYNIGVFRV